MVISDMIRAIIYWMFDIYQYKGPGTSSECENLGGQTEASLKLSPTFTRKGLGRSGLADELVLYQCIRTINVTRL